MLAKLIALLLQAKAGAISGVFLLGATGALISVSASNGVTTVTITEASPSPSASVSPSPSRSPRPSASPSASPSPTLAAPAATADCSAEAKAIAFQVQRVNSAFQGFHTDLEQLRKDHDKKALEASDKMLKEIRKSAVKAIHATKTCKHDDEDKDEDKDSTTATSTDKDSDEDKDEDTDKEDQKKTTSSPLAFSGTAESIATQAIAAMQAAFATAQAAPAATHKPETKTEGNKPQETRKPEGKHKG